MPDFIYRKENVISDSLCKSFIENFELDTERQYEGIAGSDGKKPLSGKDAPKQSTDICFKPSDLEDERWGNMLQELIDTLEEHRKKYLIHWPGLKTLAATEIHWTFNIQKYKPGESFGEYHCERADMGTSDRVLVWMIYLNDVHDGGWTEFFHYNLFEEPKAGKLLIWPADFTHIHKGLPSHTETKYILTGWYSFVQPKKNKKEKIQIKKSDAGYGMQNFKFKIDEEKA